MANIAKGMQSICADIVQAYEERKKSIADTINNVKVLRQDGQALRNKARKFLRECKRLHKEMAQSLKEELGKDRATLIKEVGYLKRDFRRKEKEVRADLTEASAAWKAMNDTLRSKRLAQMKKREKR